MKTITRKTSMRYNDEVRDTMLLEYEEILCGKRKMFSNYYLPDNKERNHELALCVIRYLFHDILCWDLATAKGNLSLKLLREYKVECLVRTRIIFPESPNKFVRIKNGDIHSIDKMYLLNLIYPEYKVDIRETTISMFKDVMTGVENKFPKEYWNEHKGRIRACICLQYVLAELRFHNVREMYEYFASNKARATLQRYHLWQACGLVFGASPLTYLHEALPVRLADEMIYQELKEREGQKNERGKSRHSVHEL